MKIKDYIEEKFVEYEVKETTPYGNTNNLWEIMIRHREDDHWNILLYNPNLKHKKKYRLHTTVNGDFKSIGCISIEEAIEYMERISGRAAII